jgi:colanic acid/amylovoran biosynthesis glycosyltransferase
VSDSKVWLCRHGVDAARFSSDRSDPQPGRIVSIGRLVPKKGFDVLVRACGELSRRGIEFDLRIIGGGPLRGELRALAEEEGIGDRVRLVGSRSQAEVAAELATAELFALSPVVMPDGDRDGIPNVLLEAMAAGVPVVASAVSGIPELLTDGVNARLVEPGRPDLVADALAALLSEAEQRSRLAAAGRELILADWSWPSAILPLRELLAGLLASPAEQMVEVAPYPVPLR